MEQLPAMAPSGRLLVFVHVDRVEIEDLLRESLFHAEVKADAAHQVDAPVELIGRDHV